VRLLPNLSEIIFSQRHKRLLLMCRNSQIPMCEGGAHTQGVVVCGLDLMDVTTNVDSTVIVQDRNAVSTFCEWSHAAMVT